MQSNYPRQTFDFCADGVAPELANAIIDLHIRIPHLLFLPRELAYPLNQIVESGGDSDTEKFYEIRLNETGYSNCDEISAKAVANYQNQADEDEATAGGWLPHKG